MGDKANELQRALQADLGPADETAHGFGLAASRADGTHQSIGGIAGEPKLDGERRVRTGPLTAGAFIAFTRTRSTPDSSTTRGETRA